METEKGVNRFNELILIASDDCFDLAFSAFEAEWRWQKAVCYAIIVSMSKLSMCLLLEMCSCDSTSHM